MTLAGLKMEMDTEVTKATLDIGIFIMQGAVGFNFVKKTLFVGNCEITTQV